jgi:hypothetical protein
VRGDRTLSGGVRFEGLTIDLGVLVEDLRGDLVVERFLPTDAPSGRARLRAASGRLAGVRFRDLDVPVEWRDGILRAEPVTGFLSEGRLLGAFRMHTRAPVAYEGEACVRGFDIAALREDLAPTGPPYTGTGTLRVAFQNRGSTLRDLTASGSLAIRCGNLGDLPAVANVISAAARILPNAEPPVFERADVDFRLEREVFHLRRIELAGDLFEMPGRGTIDLSGQVDITFTPDFVKSMLLPAVMNLPVAGDVLRGALREELFYAVRLRGDLANAEPQLVLFPPLQPPGRDPFEGTGVPTPPPRRIPRTFR